MQTTKRHGYRLVAQLKRLRRDKYEVLSLSALKEVVNTKYIDTAEPDTFYQKITIEDTANNTNTEYYYNPHFAKTVTVNENKPQAPETVCIRSARQLYALSLYYPQYADAVKDSVFRQELNIDYSRYEWTKYDDAVPAKISTQRRSAQGINRLRLCITAAAIR